MFDSRRTQDMLQGLEEEILEQLCESIGLMQEGIKPEYLARKCYEIFADKPEGMSANFLFVKCSLDKKALDRLRSSLREMGYEFVSQNSSTFFLKEIQRAA